MNEPPQGSATCHSNDTESIIAYYLLVWFYYQHNDSPIEDTSKNRVITSAAFSLSYSEIN